MTWHTMKRSELDPSFFKKRPYPVGEDLSYPKPSALSNEDWREELKERYLKFLEEAEVETPQPVEPRSDQSVEVVLNFIAQLWKKLPQVPIASRIGISYPRASSKKTSTSRAAHKRPRHTPLPVSVDAEPEAKGVTRTLEGNAAQPYFVFDDNSEKILREQRYSWNVIDRVKEKVKLANKGAGIIKVYSYVVPGKTIWSLRYNLSLRIFFEEREGLPGKVFLSGLYHHDHFDK